MNKNENRRQRKKAGKVTKNAKPEHKTPTLQQSLELAAQLHNAGDLSQAGVLYNQVLQADPHQPVALHLLGVIAHQLGKNDVAVDLISQSLAINPEYLDAYINLGNAFKEMGKLDEAIAAYNNALAIRPDADALNNLGVAYIELGQPEEAIAGYHKALAINPEFAEAHNNLGNALKDLSKLDEAVAAYHKALEINPKYFEAHKNLGNALQELKKLEDAVACYHKAVAIKPDYAEAHYDLGIAFKKLGRLDEAVKSYEQSITIKPDFAWAHYNLGNALQELSKLDRAVASYEQALSIKSDFAEAHYNLGNAFKELGRLDEAVARYHKAINLKPDYAEVHNNLGIVFNYLGQIEDAMASYHKAIDLKPDYVMAGKNLLFILLNVPGLTAKELFTEHLRFSETYAQGITLPSKEFFNDPTTDRRLRVGYLSSDFRKHPVGSNLLPLLSSHDRTKFEIFCYADVPFPDAMTERFQSCADHWHSISGKSDSEAASMVRADAIDVLVCLAGRFDNNRPLVCAHRAAPVQVSFHDGATSGLEEMDYWLTDDFLHPPDTKEMFTEDLCRLPVFYQYLPIEEAPTVEALPADSAGFVTFASFNNPAKVNEDVINLWAEVLESVPGSRLLLKFKNLYGQASLQSRMVESFAACGIEPDRVLFATLPDTVAEHLGRYGEVDIALDTFPFNGATTTFQALWMGVPVISLVGETFISRAAGSMLHHVGLGNLAVDTPEAYVDCARNLAGDIDRLRTLRAGLRERLESSPLCNAPAYARSIESAFKDIWQAWCHGPH